jgi:oligopeptidase B
LYRVDKHRISSEHLLQETSTCPFVEPAPLLLYGYGAYGISWDPSFSPLDFSLCDRGVIFAIAHVRGGGELGRSWYEDGKLMTKKNTFSDFIAAAEHLIRSGWTSNKKIVAQGGSAGGLLMAVVANERPDLFCGILAGVPFVDAVVTMADSSIPLVSTGM